MLITFLYQMLLTINWCQTLLLVKVLLAKLRYREKWKLYLYS